jgi:ABC-type multidrug transport system fused ATPase/permease subunit
MALELAPEYQEMADKIIVIEKGKVSEEGTHSQLLQQDKGLYKKLINLQSLGDVK